MKKEDIDGLIDIVLENMHDELKRLGLKQENVIEWFNFKFHDEYIKENITSKFKILENDDKLNTILNLTDDVGIAANIVGSISEEGLQESNVDLIMYLLAFYALYKEDKINQ